MKQYSESYARTEENTAFSILKRISSQIKEPREQIIFKLILETGCTSKEITGLRKEDFEFTTCSMSIGAKKKKRTVKISLELSLLLNYFIGQEKGTGSIFSTRQSKSMSERRIAQLIGEKTLLLSGKEFTPREIRKLSVKATFARTKSLAKTKAITGIKNLVEKEHLTREQAESIASQIKEEQHSIIYQILLETGCLPSELVRLRRENIDFHNHSIIFKAENTRNKQERISKISKELSLQIKLFTEESGKSENDFLFSTRQSGQISDKRVFQLVRQYSEMAGFKNISPRTIRNTCAALKLRDGFSDDKIKEQLGIKHIEMAHFGLLRASKRARKSVERQEEKEGREEDKGENKRDEGKQRKE